MAVGLFIGRFQPFHIGHLNDIKDALKEVDELVIAIGSSQYYNTHDNPFNIEERIKMIENSLKAEKIEGCKIISIPDAGDDRRWMESIKNLAPEFDVVFTGNRQTERIFKEKGYNVRKVKMIPNINATKIRDKMLNEQDWQQLVPKEVAEFIDGIDGTKRIKRFRNI